MGAGTGHAVSPHDRRFADDVESGRLAPADFDHRAHLRLAYVHRVAGDVAAAHGAVRAAIRGFLDAHGVDPGKYHETVTRAWVGAVGVFMDRCPPAASFEEFIAASPALLDPAIMTTHYSPERLWSDEARAGFVAPDRDPIPGTVPLDLPERLETERLVLRLWSPEDAPALHEALGESVDHLYPWIPWATGRAPDPAQAARLLEGWLAQRTRGENVIYAILRRDGGLVGGVGAYARVGPGALELGYWLRASAAGQGYATEATGCLADAASALPGVQRLEIHTDAANGASRRVAEKLGFHLSGAEGPRGGVVYVRARNPEESRNAPPRPGVG